MDYPNVISTDYTLLDCLKKMDEIGQKLLILTDENKFISVVSIGDVQRAIINNKDLSTKALEVTREIITVARENESDAEIREKMIQLRTESMPVIDEEGNLRRVIYWEDIMDTRRTYAHLDCPVVIMAGGEGKRLRPLTNVIPKPMVPLGDKTIIESIIDQFKRHSCKEFFISVNYKSDLIRFYLDSHLESNLRVEYFEEDKPLGTAGSLNLLSDKIKNTFFVSNCDILVDEDYNEILNYHRENGNELTVVAALKHLSLPYGTLESGDSGILKSISEKPDLNFLINSGMYVLEPALLEEIPKGTFYHITDLIQALLDQGRKVGVFPVSEKSWKDMGDWKEYYQSVKGKE